ncbi:MAG: hypothetical protein ACLUSP_00660 [Christensenellales bacterium]
MRFYKYEACGNDYVYFDCRRRAITACKLSEITVKVSDRHFGIGATERFLSVRPTLPTPE